MRKLVRLFRWVSASSAGLLFLLLTRLFLVLAVSDSSSVSFSTGNIEEASRKSQEPEPNPHFVALSGQVPCPMPRSGALEARNESGRQHSCIHSSSFPGYDALLRFGN